MHNVLTAPAAISPYVDTQDPEAFVDDDDAFFVVDGTFAAFSDNDSDGSPDFLQLGMRRRGWGGARSRERGGDEARDGGAENKGGYFVLFI